MKRITDFLYNLGHLHLGEMKAYIVVAVGDRDLIAIRLCLIEPAIGAVKIIIDRVRNGLGTGPESVSCVVVAVRVVGFPYVARRVRKLTTSNVEAYHLTEYQYSFSTDGESQKQEGGAPQDLHDCFAKRCNRCSSQTNNERVGVCFSKKKWQGMGTIAGTMRTRVHVC
jgi:hypothetical protein